MTIQSQLDQVLALAEKAVPITAADAAFQCLNFLREHGQAIRAAVGGEAVAYCLSRGDGSLTSPCMVTHGYPVPSGPGIVPLYASPPATVDVGALRELELLRDAFKQWRAFGGIETGLCDELAALIDGAGNG